jgi:hypothetical protein
MLTGKPARKRALGMVRGKWENDIRVNLKEINVNTRNWVDYARDRNYCRTLGNAALNLRVS